LNVASEFMELAWRNLELAAQASAEMGDAAMSITLRAYRQAHIELAASHKGQLVGAALPRP
jgi:hypothetical protein